MENVIFPALNLIYNAKADYNDYDPNHHCSDISIEGTTTEPSGSFAVKMVQETRSIFKKIHFVQVRVGNEWFKWTPPADGNTFIKLDNGWELYDNELVFGFTG